MISLVQINNMYTFCLSNKANDLSSTDKQTINSEILGVISLQKINTNIKKTQGNYGTIKN